MGYELHITRRSDWSNPSGPPISESEWQQTIHGDSEADIFHWDDGNVSVKNPDPALIRKMVGIATKLGAHVQGDDGEIYREDGSSFELPATPQKTKSPNIFQRIVRAWRWRVQVTKVPYKIGQRVKDPFGRLGTIYFVDPKANGGLGSVRAKMDDGKEFDYACIACGFTIIDSEITRDRPRR